ncbi:MAG TPA: Vms1/Ankzf1 family peptidyl-tRNA hydrolase [Solirubrobacteraceae bacterium]|nr:Vms1/Ankzf1 family peptidyl-tRNA hydrolase [Solirubrobacteraceae bacterium]
MPFTAPHLHRARSIGEALRRLRESHADGHSVLSLYLNFDPSEFPNLRERHMQADALLADVEQRHHDEENGGVSRENRLALREDIERVRELFAEDEELALQGARGLAVFCSTPAHVYLLVPLPRGVQARVAVGERPLIEPLIELVAPERWCVLLASRRAGRIMRGTREHLVEVAHVRDDVHGRHSQGGWSQSRYQRGIEHEADEHIRRTCALLLEHFRRQPFDRLLIAGPAELHHRVEAELQEELVARLAGHFEIDVERATTAEAHRRAMPLVEADESRRERELLTRLNEGLAPGGHAAAGVEEVLELLNERRVHTLLLAHGLVVSGFECPRCGRLALADTPCPADGAVPEPSEDIVQSAIELALDQSAEVLVIRHQPEGLAEHGPTAALLRY